jgi:Zn-dependent metalloprotease
MACNCFIVPQDVLLRFASDPELSEELRRGFAYTAAISEQIRAVRQQQATLTLTTNQLTFPGPVPIPVPVPPIHLPPIHLHLPPACQVYTCNHGTTLPGTLVPNPWSSTDGAVKRAYAESEAVAKFYWDVFGRDSIDNHHMTIISSVHYSSKFNNAFWNGTEMVYGDGDGQIFIDFTLGNDVIGHELTHGVTQHSLALAYANEPGGLNESISDCFGSMFRQWQAGQDVNAADWLIGHDIMGPVSKSKGYTCLRDMSNPAATHCLAPQPTNFSQYHAGMDPHYSSGIPNFAFYKAAKAFGGQSWGKVGQIWYKAVTGSPANPNMTMKQFANVTRSLSASDATLHNAINAAWVAVGL